MDSTPAPQALPLSTDVPLVLLASACWDVPTPVNVHQIASRLAAAGHQVLFVESTGLRSPSARSMQDCSRVRRRLSTWWRGPRQVENNLSVLSPITFPANWPKPASTLSAHWLASAVCGAMGRAGIIDPILWAFLPTYQRVVDQIPHRLLVYHCVDDYAANPGVDGENVRGQERRMLQRANLVLATSRPLAERLREQRGDVHLLPNVADVERFAAAVKRDLPEPPELRTIPRRRAVYIGNLASYRFDVDLLMQLATRLASVQFVLIGPIGVGDTRTSVERWDQLERCENVHLLGPRPHADLPAFLAHCDLGVIPLLDNDHTRSSFPLKLWEMLGAGLPVVCTDLPALYGVAAGSMLISTRGVEDFAEAIERVIDSPRSARADRLAVARQHDWAARIEQLRSLLGASCAAAPTNTQP